MVLERRTRRLTYNEGATLIFFSMWQLVDGFYDLNARISVDVDTLIRRVANDTISKWQIGRSRKTIHILRMAAVIAALLILTATTGLSRRTAASNGIKAGFS